MVAHLVPATSLFCNAHLPMPTHAVDRRGRDEMGRSYLRECGEI